jgi:hypothetical protein
MAQISMPDASTPSASAVLPLMRHVGAHRRNAELEIEIALGPLVAGVQQLDVGLDHARVLLAEGERHLVARELEV